MIRMIELRIISLAGHVARMEERINSYKVLTRKYEGKSQLEGPSNRWVYNIKMELKIGCGELE